MADRIDDGGPAFPIMPPLTPGGDHHAGYPYPEMGMSLRDWFAGQALSGLLQVCVADSLQGKSYPQHIAQNAYSVADAMIAARKGGAS